MGRRCGYEQGRSTTPIDFKIIFTASQRYRDGVDSGDNKDEGAGDQGLMFGYASGKLTCRCRRQFIIPIVLKELAQLEKGIKLDFGPGLKSRLVFVASVDRRSQGGGFDSASC